eukprot:CAMPEP_0202860678 /NCGR_PEP_ID=MMETSP1391-20130828/2309_1 /ASSEMBLY_ACC=CAM_ASM_000867 /TAXON_ID=1034604 /ORGANISM="Chlamydomonas leiostraca, Strain SAG 11-49" /LENGTH=75 /DNA_ID=CAMNT_0049539897 /DNA_START=49 /DNA_END=276 /DNA_ORIENTATION=-
MQGCLQLLGWVSINVHAPTLTQLDVVVVGRQVEVDQRGAEQAHAAVPKVPHVPATLACMSGIQDAVHVHEGVGVD